MLRRHTDSILTPSLVSVVTVLTASFEPVISVLTSSLLSIVCVVTSSLVSTVDVLTSSLLPVAGVLTSSLVSIVRVLTPSVVSVVPPSVRQTSTTGDLASLAISVTFVMLFAVSGVTASAATNKSIDSFERMMMNHGSKGSNVDLLTRLGLMNTPTARQLNPALLRPRLGSDFDADWMSIDQPSTRTLTSHSPRRPDPELLAQLADLNFSYEDEHGDRRTIAAAVRNVFEQWLLQTATCEIRYTWEDQGVLFWPRWIKHGHCDVGTPCGWPAGMTCAEAQRDTIKLLRWTCNRTNSKRKLRHSTSGRQPETEGGAKQKQNRDGKIHCRWKKVPYDVTTECFCSC